MDKKEILKRLNKWINVIQKSFVIFGIIEAVLVIIIGIASSNIYNDTSSSWWIGILIAIGVLYLILTGIKITYNHFFPASIVEELTSKIELDNLKNSISRKEIITAYISSTIALMNISIGNKNEIPEEDKQIEFSDNDIKNKLVELTKVFCNNINTLLNSKNLKFSIGVYLTHYLGINLDGRNFSNKGIIMIRDDFNLARVAPIKSLLEYEDVQGNFLDLKSAIIKSVKNGEFITDEFKTKRNSSAQIVCSNIPDFESINNQKGVIFILSSKNEPIPEDFELIISVFSNIISHWLDLYNGKIQQKQIALLSDKYIVDSD